MMRASMSTLSWMTFDRDDPSRPPHAGAPVGRVLDAARVAGFGTVGLDLVTLAGADGGIAAAFEVSDVGVLRVGTGDATAAAAVLAAVAADSGATVCSAVLEAAPDEAVVARLGAAADVLHGAGVRIALEFMAYGPLGSLAAAEDVCDQVGWDRCGLLVDSWHLMHARTPWEQVAALPAERIALVQAADAERLADGPDEFFRASRWGRLPPGEGRLDFGPFVDAIAATGYRGWLSPEVLSFGAAVGDPFDCAHRLRRAAEYLGASVGTSGS